jgi:type II secretory ATPase GspE/PulE/Tfp pilus assembly ATPase PilB-like protein
MVPPPVTWRLRLTRIKVMANLDIAGALPQDGRIG